MAGINQVVEGNPVLARDYDKRQREVLRAIKSMPRGSQAKCAFNLSISPSTISAVISGNRRSLATLVQIEQWLAAERAKVLGPVKRMSFEERRAARRKRAELEFDETERVR